MLYTRYLIDIKKGGFHKDPAQERAIYKLQKIYDQLTAKVQMKKARLIGFSKTSASINPDLRGLYLWGGVGRGKTYLLDIFSDALPLKIKQRIHFHSFMRNLHAELNKLKNQKEPLQIVARRISETVQVICLDELFVSDITDAMLLDGLLRGLFSNGVLLIVTSNTHPDDLYKNGLQRASFLPAIELIKKHLDILNIDSGIDYRLRHLEKAEIYHYPLDDRAEQVLSNIFNCIVAPESNHNYGLPGGCLEIEGRFITTVRKSDGVVWFSFQEICDGPRSTAEYIEIACCFHTVLISNLPVLDWRMENQARRFINLVDSFYDRSVKLIISAELPISEIYQGKRLVFEFQRTISRLQEMQSHEYLERPHIP
jgi:cell division protein ZapE